MELNTPTPEALKVAPPDPSRELDEFMKAMAGSAMGG